ncbi:CRISPR-associated protein Csx3 [Thermovibrio sp.]
MATLAFGIQEVPELNAELLTYRVGGADDKSILPLLICMEVPANKGVIIYTNGPKWLKEELAKVYKKNLWVAIYEPETEEAKVVISNTPEVKVGSSFKLSREFVNPE